MTPLSPSETPVVGAVYRDKQVEGVTFRVTRFDPKRNGYVYGERSDYGPWSVFRPNFSLFYERIVNDK